MRKKVLTLVVLAAVLGIGIFLFRSSLTKDLSTSTPVTAKTLPSRKLTEILSPALLKKNEQLEAPQSDADTDPRCLDFFSDIAKIDLDDFNFPIKLTTIPSSGQCSKAPEDLQLLVAEYTKACTPYIEGKEKMEFTSPEEQNRKFGMCWLYTFLLRSGVSAWKIKDLKLSEISDLRLLADKLAFAFSKLFGEKTDTTELVEVANRILEVDPKIYAAAKAVLISGALDAFSAIESKKRNVDWEKLEASYQRLLEFDRKDKDDDLVELSRLIRTQGYQPELLKTEASHLILSEPGNFLGFYLLSYSEWKLGNKTQSYAALKKAMQLAPNDLELKDNWNKIHQPGANADSFRRKVTFGINFNSILN